MKGQDGCTPNPFGEKGLRLVTLSRVIISITHVLWSRNSRCRKDNGLYVESTGFCQDDIFGFSIQEQKLSV